MGVVVLFIYKKIFWTLLNKNNRRYGLVSRTINDQKKSNYKLKTYKDLKKKTIAF